MALTLAVVHFREQPVVVPITSFEVAAPEKATHMDDPAISPDGRHLAFVATVEGKRLLWVRPLDLLAARALAGTEGAEYPFWSPDSRFLGFFAQEKLKKVDVAGGPPESLCDTEAEARGGTWNRDGSVLFAAGTRGPIQRVTAGAGTPIPVTSLDTSTELNHRWPHMLPDGRHFFYFLWMRDRSKNAVVIASLDDNPDSTERKRLLTGVSSFAYSAGHVLYERNGTLLAQRFDAIRYELQGEPFPVVQQLAAPRMQGLSAFSVSFGGALAYRGNAGSNSQLTWFDSTGKQLGRIGQPQSESFPRLSPDQKRVAVVRPTMDIWLIDLARDAGVRFTSHPAPDTSPVWSPDGNRIAFTSPRGGMRDLYQRASSGAAGEELLLKSGDNKDPTDWSADGRFLLYQVFRPKTNFDLWVLPLDSERTPVPVLETEFNETAGQFSPDVRWIAFTSDESMPAQVYVQGFPTPRGKFHVSTNGGRDPRWRRDGKELYYLSPDNKLMAVEVKSTGTKFEASRPREVFQTRTVRTGNTANYDVTADGQRFLINTALETAHPARITVVTNWAAPK